VYVARLIVSRSHARQKIGEELVDWAGVCARRGWGAKWIRIDVWTANVALHNYYKERGFEFYTIREFENGELYPSAALFQKPTADIDRGSFSRFTWSSATDPGNARPANGQSRELSMTKGTVFSSLPTMAL
jgi:hypothetical protein